MRNSAKLLILSINDHSSIHETRKLSQIGGTAVKLLAFRTGDLGLTPQSDYKLVALVA